MSKSRSFAVLILTLVGFLVGEAAIEASGRPGGPAPRQTARRTERTTPPRTLPPTATADTPATPRPAQAASPAAGAPAAPPPAGYPPYPGMPQQPNALANQQIYREKYEEEKNKCGADPSPECLRRAEQTARDHVVAMQGHPVGANQSTCQTAFNQMQTARREFDTACGEAELTRGGRNCLQGLHACTTCLNNSPGDDTYSSDGCDSLGDTADGATTDDLQNAMRIAQNPQAAATLGQNQVVPDLGRARQRFNMCPALAGQDLDKFIKEVEDTEKRVRDLEREILDEQEKMTQKQAEQETKMEEKRQQAQRIEQELQEKTRQFQDQLREIEQKIADDIQKLNTTIMEAEGMLNRLNIQENDAKRMELEERDQAEAACHASAMERVRRLREQQANLMAQSRYSAGGFNNLMNNVGLTNRTQALRLVQRYTADCKADPDYRRRLLSIARKKQSTLEKINAERTAARNAIQSARQEIDQKRAQLPEEGQRILQRISDLVQKAQSDMESLRRQVTNMENQFNIQMQIAQRRLQQLQQQLATQQDYLQQKNRYLALRRERSDGISSPANSVSKALGKGSSFVTAISSTITACNCTSCSTLTNNNDKSICQSLTQYSRYTNINFECGGGGGGGGGNGAVTD